MNIIQRLLLAGLSIIALSSCTKTTTPTAPLGPVSATGTLIPADVSLVRRGTHVLLINGKKMYFVESKTENLVEFEGRRIAVEGIAEANTVKDALPVLLVTKVRSGGIDPSKRDWEVPGLDLKISLPSSWVGTVQKTAAIFTIPSETEPVLILRPFGSGSLPIDGVPYYLAGHKAVRIDRSSEGLFDLYIQSTSSIIRLHADLRSQKSVQNVQQLRDLVATIEQAIDSASFISEGSLTMSSLASSESSQPMGVLCGGSAGIICPEGFFCNISDATGNTGTCQYLGKK
jgi:hypothetical protein